MSAIEEHQNSGSRADYSEMMEAQWPNDISSGRQVDYQRAINKGVLTVTRQLLSCLTAMYSPVYLCLICIFSSVASEPLSCRDFNNNSVDWFIVYKIPRVPFGKSNGTGFLFMSSDTLASDWTVAYLGEHQPDTPFALTLKPLYSQPDKGVWLLYNDQVPGSFLSREGHTKGVVAGDAEGGFWLVHSVPRFPPTPDQPYSYPSTGLRNGQSMLCLSLPVHSINAIGGALKYNLPHVYSRQVEAGLEETYAELLEGASGARLPSPPWYHTFQIYTRLNNSFTVFAKDPRQKDDLYALVASDLMDDVYAQTWPNELKRLASSCSKRYRVINVKSVKMSNVPIKFSNRRDHSKWMIGKTKKWTCIGDINRAKRQEKRGGGTVCLKNLAVWQKFKKLINTVEKC